MSEIKRFLQNDWEEILSLHDNLKKKKKKNYRRKIIDKNWKMDYPGKIILRLDYNI